MAAEVLTFVEGGSVGRIRLNRPRSLHALTTAMCDAMIEALLGWAADPAVTFILIDHAEGRGFCAGGDILMMSESGQRDGALADGFFHSEYRLNHLLFTYPKPVISFMDGVVMGGGVGLALPARWRIATEKCLFAMPEGEIGLFTDVGAGWYLSRLPGRVGAWLATTGARLGAADCVALNLATHNVDAARIDELKQALVARPDDAARLLDDFGTPTEPAPIEAMRPMIDRLFGSDRLEDILAALEADGGEWAQAQLEIVRSRSPMSLKVSLRLIAEGKAMADFADEMRTEYAVATRVVRSPDFTEGVRALLINKDRQPRWNPAEPADVTDAMIDRIFEPLPPGDAWTPLAIDERV